MRGLRFVVVGEDRPARAVLDLLLDSSAATVVALVTRSPTASRLAAEHDVHLVDTTGRSSRSVNESLLELDADWLISVNSVILVSESVLARYPDRTLNVHPGLLPEYAGLHAHQWAIREGATEFGATVHLLDDVVDAGDVVAQRRFPIEAQDTGLSLYSRCMRVGSVLMCEVLQRIIAGEDLVREPQDLSRRRLFRHRDALDARVDWKRPAGRIVDFIRAGNYEPFESPTYVAEAGVLDGEPLRLLRATVVDANAEAPMSAGVVVDLDDEGPVVSCGDGTLVAITRARAGRRLLDPETWRRHIESLPGRLLPGR